MALGSIQPVIEMRNRDLTFGRGGKGGRCVGLTTLTLLFAGCLNIMEASTFWSPRGLSRCVSELLHLASNACYRTNFSLRLQS